MVCKRKQAEVPTVAVGDPKVRKVLSDISNSLVWGRRRLMFSPADLNDPLKLECLRGRESSGV